MNLKKKITSLTLCGALIFSSISFAHADATRVVTIGVNNSAQQKATILKYFGVNENEVDIIEVNNQEERQYLEGIATEAQIGKKTYSCAYVQPTSSGGINVKTANLTWLTSATVASTLSTAGLENADVVVASAIPASGTGALTGIMKAFESATGESLDEAKKEIATEELVITGDLGDDIGQNVATGVVNDIKTEIIKNGTSDTTQIAETINNITNNYNITLSSEQQEKLEELMYKISQQDYNYNSMKDSLNSVKDIVDEKLKEEGIKVDRGFFESIKDWFTGIGDWFAGIFNSGKEDLGILGSTDDSALGDNAIIDATDKDAINLPSSDEVEGFFTKIWNWFTGLFNNNNNNNNSDKVESNDNSTVDSDVYSLEQNSTIDENVQSDSSAENQAEDTNNTTDSSNLDDVNTPDSETSNE